MTPTFSQGIKELAQNASRWKTESHAPWPSFVHYATAVRQAALVYVDLGVTPDRSKGIAEACSELIEGTLELKRG